MKDSQDRIVFGAVLAAFFVTSAAHSQATRPTLRASDSTLTWIGDEQAGFRPQLSIGDRTFAAPSAAAVFVLNGDQPIATRFEVDAQQLKRGTDNLVTTIATLKTPAGSRIDIEDRWHVQDDSFRLSRQVRVAMAGKGDAAFVTGVDFATGVKAIADADVFIPGLWYATAAHTPKSGLITDLGQRDFLLREDRMALPLVSVRDRNTGTTLTVEHTHPNGTTIAADDDIERVIDARLQFGSLGLARDEAGIRAVFRFPGSEGEQTSIFGYKPDLRTAERLHPMTVGATQLYELSFHGSRSTDFSSQMRDAWRNAYAAAQPLVAPFDAHAIYDASINVLDHYAFNRKGVAGFGFSAKLPDGKQEDPSLQMGFVGQQLPCASYLIDEGLRTKRPDFVAKGEAIVDFWSRESLSPTGVPRTWFDLTPTPHWRDYPTFLRVATDGTSGMLRAWQIEHAAGHTKPQWLKFCRSVGDWLLKIQNKDGSFFREWTFDSKPVSQSLTSTLHPVRLLVDLSCATGDAKYRAAAIRAANFALAQHAYVGGTPDNPDVIDKEAGWIAFDSYLALYDVTRDKKWLDAAIDAATFTETWIYTWNVPLPIDGTTITIPRVKTTAGASLIATGHSGADVFLAYASFSYLRLSIYTDDTHFADVARLLQANTAQFVDVGGSHGYATPGLLVEAFTLAVNRGHSVGTWLPWCTSAILEPMSRMREAFGEIDVAAVLKLNPTEQKRMNDTFARNRGFAPVSR
jgi:hypothetical protein